MITNETKFKLSEKGDRAIAEFEASQKQARPSKVTLRQYLALKYVRDVKTGMKWNTVSSDAIQSHLWYVQHLNQADAYTTVVEIAKLGYLEKAR